jgi:hypothetical protein
MPSDPSHRVAGSFGAHPRTAIYPGRLGYPPSESPFSASLSNPGPLADTMVTGPYGRGHGDAAEPSGPA